MANLKIENWNRIMRIAALTIATLLVAGCATTPTSPPGASEVRAKLSALQSDPNLAQHARVEIREAEEAVRIAEQPLPRSSDSGLAAHRLYLADHKVEIARARATTRYAESQRRLLGEQREQARLAARTREADRALADAQRARSDAERAQADAHLARGEAGRAQAEAQIAREEADRARSAAEVAREAEALSEAAAARRAAELQRQIELLEAEVTSRGLVLTLGDVLFATASAQLQTGADTNLDKLVNFLNQYPDRRVHVEGHTDNIGAIEYNRDLSQRRADSVRHFLTEQGIASGRITTAGMGMDRPVASNASATGRQMNRRVEIIIENPTDSQASTSWD
jgi:outer membrane protein OmpA-like peptidoglycan-associated protein